MCQLLPIASPFPVLRLQSPITNNLWAPSMDTRSGKLCRIISAEVTARFPRPNISRYQGDLKEREKERGGGQRESARAPRQLTGSWHARMHSLTHLIESCLGEHLRSTAFLAQEPMELPEGPFDCLQNLLGSRQGSNAVSRGKGAGEGAPARAHLLARFSNLLLLVAVAHQPLVSSRHLLQAWFRVGGEEGRKGARSSERR